MFLTNFREIKYWKTFGKVVSKLDGQLIFSFGGKAVSEETFDYGIFEISLEGKGSVISLISKIKSEQFIIKEGTKTILLQWDKNSVSLQDGDNIISRTSSLDFSKLEIISSNSHVFYVRYKNNKLQINPEDALPGLILQSINVIKEIKTEPYSKTTLITGIILVVLLIVILIYMLYKANL